jgi:hypothetical protein
LIETGLAPPPEEPKTARRCACIGPPLLIVFVIRAAGRDHLLSGRERASSYADRGPCRCAGLTNWWDVGPSSPPIRELRALLQSRKRRTVEETLRLFCGIDWAEDHHDVALVDHDGTLIAKRRITDGAGG